MPWPYDSSATEPVALPDTLLIDVTEDDQVSSASGNIGKKTLVGMLLSAWVDDTIEFQVSYDGSTFYPLADSSGVVQFTSPGTQASGVWVALNPATFASAKYIKVKSTTDATQTADVTITLYVRSVL